MGIKEALKDIEEEKRRNQAYLNVLDIFEPGRTRTRKKDYYRGRNEVLDAIEIVLSK